MKLLILSAFPREVRETVRTVGRGRPIEDLPFRTFRCHHASHTLTIAQTGLGVENGERVLFRLVQTDRPDAVISLGYCGALSKDLSAGEVVWASSVFLVDGQKVEKLSLPDSRGLLAALLSWGLPVRLGTFFTMKDWTKKERLLPLIVPGTAAPVCDMETYGLARICHERKLPLYALRAVSDEAERDLAFDPWAVCDAQGVYRVTRALRFFLSRPRLLAHMLELRRNSKVASRNLSRTVNALLRAL